MSANDGWLLVSVGIALMLMGIAMLAMPRQRVVARTDPRTSVGFRRSWWGL